MKQGWQRFHRVVVAMGVAACLHSTAFALVVTNIEVDGVIDIETEAFVSNIPRTINSTNYQWQLSSTVPGFSGTGYMLATPQNGLVLNNANWLGVAPELQFTVNFNQIATHYVWARMYTPTNAFNSINTGLPAQGTPNATNTGSALILLASQTNAWSWSTNRFGTNFPRPRVITAATGPQTFSVWMRADGTAIDRLILTTNINFSATLGTCFHIPNNAEVSDLTMRSPVDGITSNTTVFLYTGNQFQGAGNPGNQSQLGSTCYFRNATNSAWSAAPMAFWQASGNNKYFTNSILPNTFNAGDTVQYYFRDGYDDHLPTYIGGNDAKYELEADAQAHPNTYTVVPLMQPSGPYVAYTNIVGSTLHEIRAYLNTGHISLLGPDLNGNPLANVVTIAPGSATVNGQSVGIGAVRSVTTIANGLQLVQVFGATNIISQVTFALPGVMRYEVIDWGAQVISATAISAPSDASEHVYGFGEKFNAFDQSGNKVRILTDDPPGDKGDASYKVSPWFISTRGYGFHLDSSALSYFDMRNSAADRYTISNMIGSAFSGYVTNALKYNIVYGPKLTDVLTRFTGYTGRPPLPPAWTFGPWMSSDIWQNGGQVRYVLTKMRERNIPGNVFVFDSPWETSYNDFTWNMSQWNANGTYEGTNWSGFATLGDMMTFFRTNGWKVVCWMTPFVNTSSFSDGVPGQNTGTAANYATGLASNYFVRAVSGGTTNVLSVGWWKGTGSPVDFTNPNATLWLQNQLSNLVAQSGNVIGGFKTDDGESGNPPGSYIPSNALYADGRTGVEMQNGYALEYHRAIWNVLGTNGVLFSRSGFTGTQAFPGGWAGDNQPNFGESNGLPSVIVASQSAAMSGYSIWSHDIGGYQDSNWSSTPENLFIRWTQFGSFSPIMQMHRQVGLGLIYPWSFGDDALTNYQYFAQLHTALFPYIYSYALQSATNGIPIMRPLVLMNQADPNVYGVKHTYMFGNELLVSPIITNNATSRLVYLPQGNWYDYFTGTRYTGAQTITWNNANQHQMPLFAREGAIVPMISTNTQTLLDFSYTGNANLIAPDSSLQFLVYPTTNSTFSVYDGTQLTCQSNGTVTALSLTSTLRPIQLRILTTAPAGVERDGVRLPKFTNATAYASASLGWYYDASSGFLQAKFYHLGGSSTLMFAPDSVGDGISDSWRQYYFGIPTTTNDQSCATCDADGDGFSNQQEYFSSTSPLNPANYLQIGSLLPSGANFLINFPSIPGMTYRVEKADLLATTNTWSTLQDNIPGTGGSIQITDPNTAGVTQRFYRVKLLP